MKKFLLGLTLLLLGLAGYLVLWPVPIRAVAWNAPADRGYTDAHTANTKLANLKLISLGSEEGPEHIAVSQDGKLYAAVASGRVLRMNPDGTAQEVFAETGGRVLGFDFDREGNLIAADAIRGLLVVSPQGKVKTLTDRVGADPIRYADAVVIAANGKIYFTDASGRFPPARWGGTFEAAVLDILEQAATGRVLEFDPSNGATRSVAVGLSFPNGIALSTDQLSLFVAETGRFRVWKIDVAARDLDLGKGSMEATVLLENLPGYPDNLMRGLNGRIWLGFSGPRSPKVDAMAERPFMREVTLRLPRVLWPLPKRYGHILAFTEEGKVVEDLQDPSGAYPETTGATETVDRLYVQNLHFNSIGWLAR
jgi:sugar lactone lactonase YvrE